MTRPSQKARRSEVGPAKRRIRTTKRWARLRALLVAAHVVAIVLMSFPGGSKLGNKARWKTRQTQTQLALWRNRVRDWGYEGTDAEFELTLWNTAQRYLAVRNTLLAPVGPYANFAPQAWGMFKAPPRSPSALLVLVRDIGGPWRTVHESRSAEHAYLADTLENNRFRKQIGRCGRDDALFDDVAHWIARRAFVDFPDAMLVRVKVLRLTSLPPLRRAAGESIPRRVEKVRSFRRGAFK